MLYDLQTNLAIYHKNLYDCGESNTADVVKKRKEILDKKQPLIELYEKLFAAKEEYFVTQIVNPSLEALLHNNADYVGVEAKTKTNYNSISDIELMRIDERLRVRITKLKNRLKYQSITRQEKPNPMPDCPKRTEIESKLEELKKEREKISKLIVKRM